MRKVSGCLVGISSFFNEILFNFESFWSNFVEKLLWLLKFIEIPTKFVLKSFVI
jgi:hypothetical protein